MVLETISSLKVPAKIREYRKSDVIFDEVTTGVEMFIIYSGSVRLSTKEPGREITLATIGPGEFFGEMAVIDSAFRTASAVADEDGTKLVKKLLLGVFLDSSCAFCQWHFGMAALFHCLTELRS